MYYLGLCTMGSSSAALFKNGKLIFAVEEERLSRIKNDGAFPIKSIKECLDYENIEISNIDSICVYWKPSRVFSRIKGVLSKFITFQFFNFGTLRSLMNSFFKQKNHDYPELRGRWLDLFMIRSLINNQIGKYNGKIEFFEHHLTHQLYSEALKSSEKYISLSYDGGGEEDSTVLTIYSNGKRNNIKKIKWPNSLGHYYSFFTGYLGFRMLEGEYKMMGLAPLGNPIYADKIRNHILKYDYKKNEYIFNYKLCDYHSALYGKFNKKLFSLLCTPRKSGDDVKQFHKDLAASVQICFEEILEKLIYSASKEHLNSFDLFLSGGCALNVTANGKILKKNILKNIYLPPAPHDGGCSIGAVLSKFQKENFTNIDTDSIKNPYLGKSYSDNEIISAFQKLNLSIPNNYGNEEIISKTVDVLCERGVVAWFQGRSEFGPRALGSRSFLADPRDDSIREEINSKIKKRELFRPFAPSIMFEKQTEYFDIGKFSPYMNIVSKVKQDKKQTIPAVVHVDGTSRIHSVINDYNPIYYNLLNKFYQKTGVPVLLNTSFNIQEPIVNSPEDALITFLKSGVDLLVLGNFYCDDKWKKAQKI